MFLIRFYSNVAPKDETSSSHFRSRGMSCKRNHAAVVGYQVEILDGCQQFGPSPSNPRFCVVCGCHKGFHDVKTREMNLEQYGSNAMICNAERESGSLEEANRQLSEQQRKNSLECQFCSIPFDNRKDYLQHVIEFHPKEGQQVARADDAGSASNGIMDQFLRPSPEQKVQCTKCLKYFNESRMENHIRGRHLNTYDEQGLECDFCGKMFAQDKADSLLQHVIDTHSNDPQPYICLVCGFKTMAIGHSTRHKRSCEKK
jgi:uncharacterized C2H2 Zn-finger protein